MVLAAYVLFNYCRCYKELSECLGDWFAFSLPGGQYLFTGRKELKGFARIQDYFP